MNDSRDSFIARGGAWVVVQFSLMTAVILLGVRFRGDGMLPSVIGAGAVLFIAGGYLGLAGVAVLGKNRTAFPQPRAGSELIQHGIYSRVRHPLYASVMLASLGWALMWQSRASFAAALTLLPFFYAKARQEERRMRNQFPDYADYTRRVPRFFPRLGKRRI